MLWLMGCHLFCAFCLCWGCFLSPACVILQWLSELQFWQLSSVFKNFIILKLLLINERSQAVMQFSHADRPVCSLMFCHTLLWCPFLNIFIFYITLWGFLPSQHCRRRGEIMKLIFLIFLPLFFFFFFAIPWSAGCSWTWINAQCSVAGNWREWTRVGADCGGTIYGQWRAIGPWHAAFQLTYFSHLSWRGINHNTQVPTSPHWLCRAARVSKPKAELSIWDWNAMARALRVGVDRKTTFGFDRELWNSLLWHRGMKRVTAALQTEHLELLCQIEMISLRFLAELCSSPGVWAGKL